MSVTTGSETVDTFETRGFETVDMSDTTETVTMDKSETVEMFCVRSLGLSPHI